MNLGDFLIENEVMMRLGFFFGMFLVMGLLELAFPRRKLLFSKTIRWLNNMGLVFLNSLLLRILFPLAATGVAAWVTSHSWGFLNIFNIGTPLSFIVSILILDMAIWAQHVLVHHVPALWRLHRVHHADPDFDVTTGARFHPLEIIFSMLLKFLVILLLGPSVAAVIVFEILLNATAMFNHANVRLPTSLDRYLRLIMVTPDMHRVHHSMIRSETNSNFGFNLPWWDYLFGTYCAQPAKGHEAMEIGIPEFQNTKQITQLQGMLTIPFVSEQTTHRGKR